MAISISDMRHRVVLEAPVETADGAGGVVRAYEDAATLWAAIEPIGAEPRFSEDRGGQRITHRITLRYRNGITAHHRLRHGTKNYEIHSIHDPRGDGRFLIARVEEMPQ